MQKKKKKQEQQNTLRLPKDLLEQVNALGSGADNHYNLQLKGTSGRRITAANGKTAANRKALRKDERQQRKAMRALNNANRSRARSRSTNSGSQTLPNHNAKKVENAAPPPKSILKRSQATPGESKKHVPSITSSEMVLHASKEDIAAEDAEIAYFEKKLKMKSHKLPKSFLDDGLDFLLDGLEDDYREVESGPRGKKRKRSSEESTTEASTNSKSKKAALAEETPTDDDFSGSDSENSFESDSGSDLGLETDDGDESEEDDIESDGDEGVKYAEFRGFGSESDQDDNEILEEHNPPKTYTSQKEVKEPAKPVGKYIPPSLRGLPSSDSELLSVLRRKMQGQLNRLSEANVLQILSSVEKFYREYPRHHVTSTLTEVIVASINDRAKLLDTFMILHAGFIAAVYKIIGIDFGAYAVQTIVEKFESYYAGCKEGNLSQEEVLGGKGKEAVNLMALLTELYNFGVVGSSLVFDYIRIFVSELTELNTELLLRIVRNSGNQLRQDDPTALKSVVVMLQPAIAKAGNMSTRTKFMVETLNNLKNNKLKSVTSTSEVSSKAAIQMKKQLGLLNSRHLRATEPLRPTLKDIKDIETKGKWWLVGASWRNDVDDYEPVTTTTATGVEDLWKGDEVDVSGDFATPDLIQLAREQRMNTGVRRAIFVAIMSSNDFRDAVARLQKLRLKRAQEREIPRVIIHCCGSEENYNHFYTLVAGELCSRHSTKMAFQFCLWEMFRGFGEDDRMEGSELLDKDQDNDDDDDDEVTSEDDDDENSDSTKSKNASKSLKTILNLAKLYGTLIGSGVLPIAVLKILNFYSLQPKTRGYLEILFATILQCTLHNCSKKASKVDKKGVQAIFNVKGMPELARGIEYFLRKHVKLTELAATPKECKLVRKSCVHAQQVLKAVAVTE